MFTKKDKENIVKRKIMHKFKKRKWKIGQQVKVKQKRYKMTVNSLNYSIGGQKSQAKM